MKKRYIDVGPRVEILAGPAWLIAGQPPAVTQPPVRKARQRGNTLGAAAMANLQGRRDDPYHPAALVARNFNPALHPHDPHSGEFIGTPGGGAVSAVKDLLDLAGRIDLDPREKLISSGRFDGENGSDTDLNWAVVHSPVGNEVRIGIIPAEDSDKWRAAELGGTAILDAGQVRTFHGGIAGAQAEAKKAAKEADALYAGGGLPSKLSPRQEVLVGKAPVAEGVVPTDWADLHWAVHLTDDENNPWQLTVWPADPETFTGNGAEFGPKTVTKLLKQLEVIESELADPAARGRAPRRRSRRGVPAHTPAGIKGAHQLHEYWTKGEGLAKWAESPHPWTALYHHLLKYMSPGMAKKTASQWFHDVFGIWPGEREGQNPVGPG